MHKKNEALANVVNKIIEKIKKIKGLEVWSKDLDTQKREMDFTFDYEGDTYIAFFKKTAQK
ncbi:MAG TPA: hypothetical protein VMZ91_06420 [Candidatus Paceibacterota bacterium]|nr:hypothetical protein [Candidatus Paceibacterota bacterium]